MEEVTNESSENNILYELLIYAEWPQEPEVLVKGVNDRPDERANTVSNWGWRLPFSSSVCPSAAIQNLVNMQMPWQFAVGEEGHVVAILQDQVLEIRSFRDEYGSVIGRAIVTRDMFPQWRKLVWSPDCTMLALSHSNGNIDVYDLIGAHLFLIENGNSPEQIIGQDFGIAIAGLVFSDLRIKNTQWSFELILANYKGDIKAYFLSLTDGYKESHEFSLSSYYPNGISTLCCHRATQMLLICGPAPKVSTPDLTKNAFKLGITAWRMVIGQPYYKLSLSLEEEMAMQSNTWWSALQLMNRTAVTQDIVYKLSVSPNEDILAAIHTSGALSLWDLPSMRLKKYLDLTLQPNYSDCNPQLCEPGMKRKAASLISSQFCYHLLDVNWWSNDAMILARCSGAVLVSSIRSLKNLLGISPEWFEPSVQVSASYQRGFLAMECERVITKKKRSASELYDMRDDEDSSDDDDLSFFTRTSDVSKKIMFYITDNERFRPPRKKMKFLNKTYRLLCLKSTTPEELFTRKINNEEYGEALALAKTYNLDSDLVYQRQWRKTPATVASIQDYLSKITKRSWVLHECLERVPETIEAAKELLLYGLRGTDLEALIAIGNGEDHGRFILGEPMIVEEYSENEKAFDSFSPCNEDDDDDVEAQKQELKQKRLDLLKEVNFSKLTLEQKQLCQCRLKLLVYLDRLTTYEAILGGSGMAEEFYDYNFFKKFRIQSGFEACLSFAHISNYQAIAAMFTYHGEETLQHKLPILSNFPETTSPVVFQSILPKLGYSENGPVVCTWNEESWREPDWCEVKFNRIISTPVADDFTTDFYESNKELLKYGGKLTPKLLTAWFIERAHEIESKSSLVDNALDLIMLGMERNIQGLEKLLDDLKTLEILVYECQLEQNFSLKDYEERDNFEIVHLLMSKSDEHNFIKHVRLFLLPFLDRCERHNQGCRKVLLKRYLVDVSKDNLKFCRKIIENSRLDQPDPLITNIEDQISVAFDCIYTCERSDCLRDICIILEQLPIHNSRNSSAQVKVLQEQIRELEKHLRVAELLEKNGTAVTIGFIKNCSEDTNEIKKLLTKLTRFAGRRHPVLDEAEWRNLLLDMLEIQKQLFPCLTAQDCYEIYLQSLLCSGRQETINLAGKLMERTQKSKKMPSHSGQSSLSYKLRYENSVTLVLKASQEYFNSSSNPSDPCMTLAGSCLKLIEDESARIEEERDLILSLKLLQEFNVNILPLQVRLCSDKLTLVQRALANKINGYRNSQKLMQLAYLLRVCGDNKKEREGKVLSLIAEAAFSAKDYDPCMNACQQLIEGGYKEGWSICYRLGGCKEFSDIAAKCELMSFSLVHCSSELLEDILNIRAKLQLQVICDRVQFLMGDDFQLNIDTDSDVTPDQSENKSSESENDTLWHTGEKTLQVLQTATKAPRDVLTLVGGTGFWKQAIKYLSQPTLFFSLLICTVEKTLLTNNMRWIKPHALSWEDNSLIDEGPMNKDLHLQGVSAFYSGLIDSAHISQFETNYQRYARPDLSPSLEVASHLFRASLLEDTLKSDLTKSHFNATVSRDLAAAYLSEDIHLTLSYLLCLKKLSDIEEFFKKFPNTQIVLQFASFVVAFRICALANILNSHSTTTIDQLLDATEIVRKAEELINSKQAAELKNDSEIKKAFELLNKYKKMLYDFIQAEILHSIGGGVDAARFTSDDVYKKDTILGIAMTSDDSVFHIAVSLAHHYKLSLWEVYMAQLEYLFSDSRTTTADIESRIEKLNLLNTLLKQPKLFKEKLEQRIGPNIDGKDHQRLQKYFTLLELCGDEPDVCGNKPTTHKKLLTKFRAAVKSLDYTLLMKPGSSLSYLSTFLNESNVHVFAKSASKIPDENGGFLNASVVYCTWVKKNFFEGSASHRKIPQTVSEWLHRYESCHEMVQRLMPPDFLNFIDYIVFTETSLQKLNTECRSEIIRRALKYSKQKNSKNQESGDTTSEWNDIINCLQTYQQHLGRMEDPILIGLKNTSDPKIISYRKDFDLSQSNTEKLRKLLTKVVVEGPDLPLLKTLLSCCPFEIEWEPSNAYIEAIHHIIGRIRGTESDSPVKLRQCAAIKTLEDILMDISKYKDELLIDDVVVDILYDFCQDITIPVAIRLQVLQVLEKTNYFIEEYSNLLLLYQTQAVVASIWPDFEVTEDDVKDELQRYKLFKKLILSSTTLDHLVSLAELLCHWPSFVSLYSESDENTPWTVVLCRLASCPEKKGLSTTIHFFDKAHSKGSLSPQACCKIFHEIVKQGSILHVLKFSFKTMYEELHESAISILKQTEKITDEDFDEELLALVLQRHLTVRLVSTSLYKAVIEFLLNLQEDERETDDCYSMDTVIKELLEANYHAEAGSLILITSQTHTGLSTFSAALSILNKWLPK